MIRSAVPLRLRPVPSRLLGGFLILAHGSALGALIPLPWPAWALIPAAVLLAVSLVFGWRRHVSREAGSALVEAIWDAEGRWTLILASGRRLDARLLPDSYVGQRLVVLNFRVGRWGGRSLVLTGDSLDTDTLRRLRVRLRIEGDSTQTPEGV